MVFNQYPEYFSQQLDILFFMQMHGTQMQISDTHTRQRETRITFTVNLYFMSTQSASI